MSSEEDEDSSSEESEAEDGIGNDSLSSSLPPSAFNSVSTASFLTSTPVFSSPQPQEDEEEASPEEEQPEEEEDEGNEEEESFSNGIFKVGTGVQSLWASGEESAYPGYYAARVEGMKEEGGALFYELLYTGRSGGNDDHVPAADVVPLTHPHFDNETQVNFTRINKTRPATVVSKNMDGSYVLKFADGFVMKSAEAASLSGIPPTPAEPESDESDEDGSEKGTTTRKRNTARKASSYVEEESDDDSEYGTKSRKRKSVRKTTPAPAYAEDESDDESDYGSRQKRKRVRRATSTPAGKPRDLEDDPFEDDYDPSSEVKQECRVDKILARRVHDGEDTRFEYLVKWRNMSYLKLEWVSETELENDCPPRGKQRLLRFIQQWLATEHGINEQAAIRMGESPPTVRSADFFDPQFIEVDRILDYQQAEGGQEGSLDWQKEAQQMLSKIINHKLHGYKPSMWFMEAVDEEKHSAFGYYSIITHPMDFGMIRERLVGNKYASHGEFAADMRLVFANCRLFNQDPQLQVMTDAKCLETLFENKYHELVQSIKIQEEREEKRKNARAKGEQLAESEQRKYLIKWKGMSYKEATWEFEQDVLDDLKIAAFHRSSRPAALKTAKEQKPFVPYSESPHFKGGRTVRSYQLEGVNWILKKLLSNQNCILADEMGLGKTLQSVTVMWHLREKLHEHDPFLVVAPLSTLPHWKREIETWTDLNVVVYHDPQGGAATRALIRDHEFYVYSKTKTKMKGVWRFHCLVTSYEILSTDLAELKAIKWGLIVVDEGQRLKNASSQLVSSLEQLHNKHRLVLSGTPLQNNMRELWAILHYIEPERFASDSEFLAEYGDVRNAEQAAKLTALLQNYMIRRLKEQVEKSIPIKEETIIDVELTTLQKQYYRAVHDRNRQFLCRPTQNIKGPSLLNLEVELRKCCNHPFLIQGARQVSQGKDLVQACGKMVLLDKLLPKLKSEGHKVLIFSQMTSMLDILQEYCALSGYPTERLDGTTRGNERQAAIDRFSNPAPTNRSFVFLLSTRAGGVGINLTCADTVIIYDSDWNPQNDIQAMSRVHRIGQKSAVKVYRLITRATYEAGMFARAAKKLGLEQAILGDASAGRGSDEEIERLLREGAYGSLIEDEESKQRMQAFCDADIATLLIRGSRVVAYDRPSALNFSKTSFSTGEDSVSMEDPNFWALVLGKDFRETLMTRLTDGTATSSAEQKRIFLEQVKQLGEEVIAAKLEGVAQPPYEDALLSVLSSLQTMKKTFTMEECQAAAALHGEVRRPKRKRIQVLQSDQKFQEEDDRKGGREEKGKGEGKRKSSRELKEGKTRNKGAEEDEDDSGDTKQKKKIKSEKKLEDDSDDDKIILPARKRLQKVDHGNSKSKKEIQVEGKRDKEKKKSKKRDRKENKKEKHHKEKDKKKKKKNEIDEKERKKSTSSSSSSSTTTTATTTAPSLSSSSTVRAAITSSTTSTNTPTNTTTRSLITISTASTSATSITTAAATDVMAATTATTTTTAANPRPHPATPATHTTFSTSSIVTACSSATKSAKTTHPSSSSSTSPAVKEQASSASANTSASKKVLESSPHTKITPFQKTLGVSRQPSTAASITPSLSANTTKQKRQPNDSASESDDDSTSDDDDDDIVPSKGPASSKPTPKSILPLSLAGVPLKRARIPLKKPQPVGRIFTTGSKPTA